MTPRVSLLDPRFNYVPAAATDVAGTWKRFGFDARANAERRARLKRRFSVVASGKGGEAPVIRLTDV